MPQTPGVVTFPTPGIMPGASGGEELIYDGHPAVLGTFGAWALTIVTLGIYAIYAWAKSRSTHYRITSQRIVIDRGLVSKSMEQVDLYRVVDYSVEQPFGQRLVGTGTLVLETEDATAREIRIEKIRGDVRALYERVRYATEQQKRIRGVRVLDTQHM